MSVTNFIPSVWSAQLLVNLYKRLVFAQTGIVNRDYEGEISKLGDSVRITSIGPITVSDFTRNADINSPEALTDAQTVMTIEKSKYFNFAIDDADQAQANVQLMSHAMREASYALANGADQYIAGFYSQASNTWGATGSPKTISAATDAYDDLTVLGTKLDESDVPADGRWVVVPPWYHAVIRKDTRFIQVDSDMANNIKMNGVIARAAGFDIYKSNNVQKDVNSDYKIMAGHPMAISFAEQVNEVEAYRPEKRFADAVKGLLLYGGKVVRPQALAVLTITRPASA